MAVFHPKVLTDHINNISYKTPFTIESFKNYKYSQSGVPYSEDILIPLDVGESFLNEFNLTISQKKEMLKLLTKSNVLLVVDNREVTTKIKLPEIQAL